MCLSLGQSRRCAQAWWDASVKSTVRHRGKGGKTRIGAPSTLEPGPDSYLLCHSIPVRASHIRPLGPVPKALRRRPRRYCSSLSHARLFYITPFHITPFVGRHSLV